MLRFCFFIVSLLSAYASSAQKADSLFVADSDEGWMLKHKVKAGETVFSIARKYHVPPAMLADANSITYQQQLAPNTKVLVPLGAFNFIKSKPETGTADIKPLYFRVHEEESLYHIARNTNVPQKTIQQWNNMASNDIAEGQRLLVGWVLYDATNSVTSPVVKESSPSIKPAISSTTTAIIPKTQPVQDKDHTAINRPLKQPAVEVIILKDTIKKQDSSDKDSVSVAEAQYNQETNDGQSIVTEKGPAVFYKSSANDQFFYAFHNSAPKGQIIKVKNTGNGKIVYVKILGPLPQTGLYHNCIIGITSKARAALGVIGDKAWCEISYAP